MAHKVYTRSIGAYNSSYLDLNVSEWPRLY